MSQHHESADALSRRGFLRAGTAAAGLALTGPAWGASRRGRAERCLVLNLVGGPSHLDTFDPKPDAPAEVRGPFRTIPTRTPGVRFSECMPRLAALSDRFAVVRSLHHTEAPIHETGQQLLQTGRICRGVEYPHFGAVLSAVLPPAREVPAFIVLPRPLGSTGVSIDQGQGAGYLGPDHAPIFVAADLRTARRMLEAGVRCVVVNTYSTVFDGLSWDCHADGTALPTTLADYRDTVCPQFDRTFAALLTDLHERGLLESTLVMAMGEFGRTPKLNARGGRDHWPGAWSILLAGGGVQGGRVVGATDAIGSEPTERPVTPAEVVATVYHAFGIDPRTTIPGPDGRPLPLADAAPIGELF